MFRRIWGSEEKKYTKKTLYILLFAIAGYNMDINVISAIRDEREIAALDTLDSLSC